MMELKTNCKDCLHNKMCRFKGNAESDFEKLAGTTYGDGVNDDYSWEIMLSSRHVNVTFSCADFLKKDILFHK